MIQNLREVIRFPSYNPVLTLGGALASWLPGIGHMIKWGLGLGLGLLLAVEWWQVRGKGFRHFCWTACLTLVITQMMGIPTDPGNFILFFPALMVIFATWDQRWRKFGSYAVLAAAALLGVGLWFLFILTLERTYQPVQSPVMFLPLPAFTMLGMYWVRWWMVKPILAAMEESSY